MDYMAGVLGSFVGALVFTFLITRVVLKATETTKRGAFITFGMGMLTACIFAWAAGGPSVFVSTEI